MVHYGEDPNKFVYLPTSLCYEASLPKDFTTDKSKMANIRKYMTKDPSERYERINLVIKKF